MTHPRRRTGVLRKQSNEDSAQALHTPHSMTMVGFHCFNVFGFRKNLKGAYVALVPLFISKLLKE